MKHKSKALIAVLLLFVTILALSSAGNGMAHISAAQGTAASTAAPGVGLLDPGQAALRAAGGKQLGGSVSVLGVLGGAELDKFMSSLKPFEEATGIKVEYESTRDLSAVLQTRVDGGNPPDVVTNPVVGQMIGFANSGKLIDLSQFLDMTTINKDYDQGLLNTVSSQGKLYGIFDAVNLEGLIWYNPKTYKGPLPAKTWDELDKWARQTAASGTTPWCIGLESGAASGWPGVVWLTELVLRQAGPEKYDQWRQGKLAWSSPEIKAAFQTFGKIATDSKLVNGGPTAVLATSFANGGDALYSNPPACYLHHQASFFGGLVNGNFPALKPIEDINFFPFPDVNPDYKGLRQISGEVMGMFRDTPQARALVAYLATPEAQSILAGTGSWMSANKRIPLDKYPSPFTKRAAEVLVSASSVHYDASALMPQAMNDAFTKAVLSYVQNPDHLDTILADLDSVQKTAYK